MTVRPEFVARNAETITADQVTDWEGFTGKTLYPAQVERLLIDLLSYRETLTRQAIQETGEQNLLSFALGDALDALAELLGASRLSVSEEVDGSTVVTVETDEAFRARLLLAASRAACGTLETWRYYAMSVSPHLIDMGIEAPEPGRVLVYPLADSGPADATLLAQVRTQLNDSSIRPLTDEVVVIAPTAVVLSATVSLIVSRRYVASEVVTAAQTALTAFSAARAQVLGVDLRREHISAVVLAVSGVIGVLPLPTELDRVLTVGEVLAGTFTAALGEVRDG